MLRYKAKKYTFPPFVETMTDRQTNLANRVEEEGGRGRALSNLGEVKDWSDGVARPVHARPHQVHQLGPDRQPAHQA